SFGFVHSALRSAAEKRAVTGAARPASLTLLAWTLVLVALVPWLFQDTLFGFASKDHPKMSAVLLGGWAITSALLEMAGLGLLRGMTWARTIVRGPIWILLAIVGACLFVAANHAIIGLAAGAAVLCAIAAAAVSTRESAAYFA